MGYLGVSRNHGSSRASSPTDAVSLPAVAPIDSSSIAEDFGTWYTERQWNALELPSKVKREEAYSIAHSFEQEMAKILSSNAFVGRTLRNILASGVLDLGNDDSDALLMSKLLLQKMSTESAKLLDLEFLGAEHKGSRNNERGDMHIKFRSPSTGEITIFEEIKAGGSGTLGNTTPDLIAKAQILPGLQGFNDFLRERKHLETVMGEWRRLARETPGFAALVAEADLTETLASEPTSQANLETISRFGRGCLGYQHGNVEPFIRRSRGDFDATQTAIADRIEKIIGIANKAKQEYLVNFRDVPIQQENAKKLSMLLLQGAQYDQAKMIELVTTPGMDMGIFVDGYDYSIFSRDAKDRVKLRRYGGMRELMEEIGKPENSIELVQNPGQSSFSFALRREDGELFPLLGFSLNWRNVFQGIATPSLNIFMRRKPTKFKPVHS
jgi:hypothetical protein